MTDTSNGNVTLTASVNGIATISFYHAAQNSLPAGLLRKLTDTITAAGNDALTR
ncbi:MAG: methylglutaconyl-CoA hydratase, partial [Mucilaginibacter sp.]|nr:methylglutaconyl-CoA hydratase [Mucilaginibacter sp.]